jgi:hypothetical protein
MNKTLINYVDQLTQDDLLPTRLSELAADQTAQRSRLIKQLGPRTPESHVEDVIVSNTPPLAGGSQGDNQ